MKPASVRTRSSFSAAIMAWLSAATASSASRTCTSTINVPLILAGPGVATSQRCDAQCYLRDLFPTVCELTKIAMPQVDGRSLAPVLRSRDVEVYPFIVGYFQDSQRMILMGDWKLIWYPKINRWQLFDLAHDPHEL